MEGTLSLTLVSEPVDPEAVAVSPRKYSWFIGIIFYTYAATQTRMKRLHDMLDGGALDVFGPSGIVEVFLLLIHPIIFADLINY